MPTPKYAAKRDENEPGIIDVFKAYGWAVHRSNEGNGFPDLVCGRKTKTILVEVKMPGKRLNSEQADWHEAWPGTVHIVHDVKEAEAVASWER